MTTTDRRGLIGALLLVALGCSERQEPAAVGTLERQRIELRAEHRETILRLAVAEGARVEPGQVLVELDARRVRSRFDQAAAARDAAQARLDELLRGTRREEVERARAELAAAEATLLESGPEVERVRRLVTEGVAAESQLDRATATHESAVARRRAAESSLERLLNGASVEELEQARAQVSEAAAAVARREIDVERMTVAAPRAGTVDALPFEEGDQPPAGATVAVLLSGDAPYARVYIPAETRPAVRVGQAASVQVDGFEQPFAGRVRAVSSEAAFTPYFALTEHDRGHLAYLAEVDLVDEAAADLPTGLPVEVSF